jgi:hypothetical protein
MILDNASNRGMCPRYIRVIPFVRLQSSLKSASAMMHWLRTHARPNMRTRGERVLR